ncbi:M48 family metallopeptidase [Alcaligenaceae bacterium]|nr:M48 family metallopeptidase [Alcaligenaceae bacterium]
MSKKTVFTTHVATRLVSASLALLMCCAGPVRAQPMGIPSMGVASAAELSPEIERTLGDAIMEQGRRDPTYITDPDVNQYLTQLGRKLAANAPSGIGQTITVFAVRDPQVNAFALPGGYIGINTGLMVTAKSESELASVIAHEIGHVGQRHIARGMTQSAQSNHLMLAALAGALLAALSGSGDLAMGVAAFGQAAAVDRQLGFSRQAEQEADRVGFDMLRKAGFDPQGMVEMFNQLSNASRLNEGRGGNVYTSTHPLTLQRMSDIQNRLREMPPVAHKDSNTFWYVRAKMLVLQSRGGQAQRSARESLERSAQSAKGVEQSAAWYGLALDAWQKKDAARAGQLLQKAREGGYEGPEIASLGVALTLSAGDAAQALQKAEAAWHKWPSSQGLALARVEAMQKAGHDRDAVAFLQILEKKWPDLSLLYKLQAQSYERIGQQVEARRSMSVFYELTGALPAAVEQLRQARAMTKDFYAQSELDARIRSLKDRLEADRQLLERFKS